MTEKNSSEKEPKIVIECPKCSESWIDCECQLPVQEVLIAKYVHYADCFERALMKGPQDLEEIKYFYQIVNEKARLLFTYTDKQPIVAELVSKLLANQTFRSYLREHLD